MKRAGPRDNVVWYAITIVQEGRRKIETSSILMLWVVRTLQNFEEVWYLFDLAFASLNGINPSALRIIRGLPTLDVLLQFACRRRRWVEESCLSGDVRE